MYLSPMSVSNEMSDEICKMQNYSVQIITDFSLQTVHLASNLRQTLIWLKFWLLPVQNADPCWDSHSSFFIKAFVGLTLFYTVNRKNWQSYLVLWYLSHVLSKMLNCWTHPRNLWCAILYLNSLFIYMYQMLKSWLQRGC